jgi:glutamine amidotransferase PdxT
MNSEHAEFELKQLHGKRVTVVRPYYGTQSDSWAGELYLAGVGDYPLKFQFVSSISILFKADDVVNVETNTPIPIIRLKGPQHYIQHPQDALR